MTEDDNVEWGDKAVNSFWRRGTAYIFDVRITDSDAASNRGEPTAKILERNETGKKKKYQEKCWAMRQGFTSLIYTVDGMAGRYVIAAEKY